MPCRVALLSVACILAGCVRGGAANMNLTCPKTPPEAGEISCPAGTELIVKGYYAEHFMEPVSMGRSWSRRDYNRREDDRLLCAHILRGATGACLSGFRSSLSPANVPQTVGTWSCRNEQRTTPRSFHEGAGPRDNTFRCQGQQRWKLP